MIWLSQIFEGQPPYYTYLAKRKMIWLHRFIKGQHPYCIYMAIRKDHDQNLAILGILFFPSQDICAELC